MVVDPDLKHAMQTQVYGLGSCYEVVLSPVQGVFLCTLWVCTPKPWNMALNKGIWVQT